MQPSLPSHHPLLGPDTAILAAQQQSASASFFHNQRTNTAHQDANSNAVLAPASGAMPFTVAPPQAHAPFDAGALAFDAAITNAPPGAPNKHTTYPYVTGTSVLAIKYKDGIMMAADTLGAYGATKRYKSISRIVPAAPTTLVGAGGEISDFQYISKLLTELNDNDVIRDDGVVLKPRGVFAYLQRVMYNRRNKFDPLWNSLVVGGVDQATGEAFLGTCSMIGVSYTDSHVATGFGNHLARPLFRNEQRDDMTEQEARALLEKALRVCYYRDKNSINKFVIGTVTKESGMKVSEPFSLSTEWGYDAFVHPTKHALGSW